MRIYYCKVNLVDLVCLILLILPEISFADIVLASEGVYFQNTLTTSNSPNASNSYFDFSANLNLKSRSNFFVGLILSSYSNSGKDSSATSTYWSEQNIGLTSSLFLGSKQSFSLTGGYLIKSDVSYKLGSNSTEIWAGTGLIGKASYRAELAKNFKIIFSFLYSMNTYTSSRVGGAVSTISKSNNYLLPTIGVQYSF